MTQPLPTRTPSRRPFTRLALIWGTALLLALLAGSAQAATLQVCAGCPYTTIQAAVDAAANGDLIVIAPGTYAESVTIQGARELTLRPPVGGRVTIDATGFTRALEIANTNTRVQLTDIDLENADGWAGLVNHGTAWLETVYVQLNSGSYGGIFNTGVLHFYANSVLAGNSSTALGAAGGLNNFGAAYLRNCTVLGNSGHEGGGFNTRGNSLVLVEASSISGNFASSMGGGYFNSSPLATVDFKSSSSFSSNIAAHCDTYYDVNQSPDCVD